MAKRKSRRSQVRRKSRAPGNTFVTKGTRQLQRQRAKLIKSGLYTKTPKLTEPVSRYQRGLIKKFADVLSGRATVVKAKNEIQALKYRDSFIVKGARIVVPRQPGERVVFRASVPGGQIRSTRVFKGRKVTRTIAAGQLSPLGPGEYYVIPFANGQRFRTNDIEALTRFMEGYEKKATNPFKDWRKYVEVETVDDADENTVSLSSFTKSASHRRNVRKRKRR